MEKNLMVIQVDKPFPFPLPFAETTEGSVLELNAVGCPELLLLYPGMTKKEYAFLNSGFTHYAVGEFVTPGCTLIYWVFKYPSPGGYIDGVLHGGLYQDDRAHKFVAAEGNILQLVVLDHNIVRLIRLSGIDPNAMDLLRGTVRKQLTEQVSRKNYEAAVRLLQQLPSKELYRRGQIFRHRPGVGKTE